MTRPHLVLSTLLLVASGWFVASSSAQPFGTQDQPAAISRGVTVYLVRHAEKGTDDPRDPALTAEGSARAEELAHVLGSAGGTQLYSTPYKRTRATLEPLAKLTGLSVDSYDPRGLDELVKQLSALPEGSVAVVAGHSNTTPGLYEQLGGKPASGLVDSSYGKVIPDDGYDRLFSVTLGKHAGELRCINALELRFGKR